MEFLSGLAPLFQVLLWIALALGVAAILFTVVNALFSRRAEKVDETETPRPPRGEDWRPPEKAARALLGDADELAARGRFAEAAHLLLYRSIDDILRWQPNLLRPAP